MASPALGFLGALLVATACQAETECPEVSGITDIWKKSLSLLHGCPGIQGPPGLMGAPGQVGHTGDGGLPGTHGAKGERGYHGEAGEPGDNGLHGATGSPGVMGLPGFRGPRGDPFDGPRDCVDVREQGATLTGWYYIFPEGSALRVMCDMETDGGGWTVFQRRSDGSVNFNRDWDSYRTGFGNQWSEFWLGNDNIHALTSSGTFELRVDLEDFANNRGFAVYRDFRLGGEMEQYALYLGKYEQGNAGDSLSLHRGRKFTTFDNDNDESAVTNCAVTYSAAWWHQACYDASLNGEYLRGEHGKKGGIAWTAFKDVQYSLKFTEMKFRREEEQK